MQRVQHFLDKGLGSVLVQLPVFLQIRDGHEQEGLADVVQQAREKGFVHLARQAAFLGDPFGSKGAGHGVDPELVHVFADKGVVGGEGLPLGQEGDQIGDFGQAKTDHGVSDRGHFDHAPVKGRVGHFEKLAGQGRIAQDLFFDDLHVRVGFGHFLLDGQPGAVEGRELHLFRTHMLSEDFDKGLGLVHC